jgi:membrane fusion protein (multidrug efflux system)
MRNEMNRKIITMIIIAGSVLSFSCGENEAEVAREEKAIAVTVEQAVLRDLGIQRVFTGTLEGVRQAQIFASIPEAVVDLPVSEGSVVKAGQPVIFLDKRGSFSRYNQSKAVYLEAKDNFEKMGRLYEQGAVSEQAFNNAKTGFEVASANFTAARQRVELTSPINGVLTDLSVNIGEFVPLGIPLATIAQTDMMRMTFYVDGKSVKNIKVGQVAEITVDIIEAGEPQFRGTVTEVSKSADPATRLFRVELKIDNESGAIKPGMFARARITVADLKSVLTVPKEAVFSVEGVWKTFLFEGSRAAERTITVGETTSKYAHVLSGIGRGDTVIVIGRNLIEDGSPVKIASLDPGDAGGESSSAESSPEG